MQHGLLALITIFVFLVPPSQYPDSRNVKNVVFWHVTPSVSFLRSVRRLLVTTKVVPSSPNLVTLMTEALRSSETFVLTRVTRRNIPENSIPLRHRPRNLNCYIALTGWTVLQRNNVSPVKYELGFLCPRRRYSS
jgi:hypothetical protein